MWGLQLRGRGNDMVRQIQRGGHRRAATRGPQSAVPEARLQGQPVLPGNMDLGGLLPFPQGGMGWVSELHTCSPSGSLWQRCQCGHPDEACTQSLRAFPVGSTPHALASRCWEPGNLCDFTPGDGVHRCPGSPHAPFPFADFPLYLCTVMLAL